MVLTPWLLLLVAALAAAALGAEVVTSKRPVRSTVRLGWWAPPEEQERLSRILARNPTYDERTGLTSDRELARWLEDNQP